MNAIRSLRPYAVAAPLVVAALLLSGCGGSGSGSSAGGAAPTGGGQATGAAGARAPGVFGLVAQISGKTLQVQSTSDQTAVTYTNSTKFTATVAATKKDVTVGSCVVVRTPDATGGTAGATPTARPTQSSSVTAASVTITAASGGQCAIAAAFGGGGGFRGTGGGGTGGPGSGQFTPGGARPSGAPTGGAGQGGGRGFGGGFAQMTVGKVTAVSGSGFTVAAETFAGRQGSASSAPTTPSGTPSLTTRTVTVTTSGTTTYTTTKAASASALAVGKCVSARGATDTTGSVTATSIAVTPAVDGACALRGA
jgi:Domain of unknown function (DUF5666)